MADKENIFVRAKAYQAKHPRTTWANCIQACKGKKRVSGVKAKVKKIHGVKHSTKYLTQKSFDSLYERAKQSQNVRKWNDVKGLHFDYYPTENSLVTVYLKDSPKRSSITGARPRKKAVGAVKVATTAVKHDVISRSQKIVNQIDALEKKRAAQKTKAMKDIVQLVINAKHKELNSIMSSLKKRG